MIRLNILGYKGYYVLANMPEAAYSLIDEVIIARDNKIHNDYFTESVNFCKSKNIPYFERKIAPVCKSKYTILIGWKWISTDDATKIILHDSLLPKYRGFNPLVGYLINGENAIGATCLFGDEEYDKGEIICQKMVTISYPLKIQAAIEIISELYLELLLTLFESIKNDKIISTPQQDSNASYSLWRDDDDYWIDWTWSSEKIKRFIDAVGFPYLGAKCQTENKTLHIFDAEVVPDVKIENRTPGKLIHKYDDGLVIVCGTGLLKIPAFYESDGTPYDFSNKFRIRLRNGL